MPEQRNKSNHICCRDVCAQILHILHSSLVVFPVPLKVYVDAREEDVLAVWVDQVRVVSAQPVGAEATGWHPRQ